MTRTLREHPVVQLTLMRVREMVREPGVLFWIFGFPILISVGLGLAFRSKGPEPVAVGALPGTPADVTGALERGGVEVHPLDAAAERAPVVVAASRFSPPRRVRRGASAPSSPPSGRLRRPTGRSCSPTRSAVIPTAARSALTF